MSLGGRLINVFSGPGEVFEAVKKGPPCPANWVLPVLLSCLVGIISAVVVLSQDSIIQQLREQQEKRIEQRIASMPKEQREKVQEMMEAMFSPTLLKISYKLSNDL